MNLVLSMIICLLILHNSLLISTFVDFSAYRMLKTGLGYHEILVTVENISL